MHEYGLILHSKKTLTHLWVYKQLLGLAQMQLAPPTKMVDKSSL